MLSNEWTVELSTYNHRTPRKSEKRSVMCLVENNFARVMTSLFSISKIGAVCCRRCQEQLSYFAVIPKGCCCSLRLSRGMPACSSAELELNFPGNFPSSYQSPLSCSTFLLSPFYTYREGLIFRVRGSHFSIASFLKRSQQQHNTPYV